MPAPRNRRHILVPGDPVSEPFTSRGSGGTKKFKRPDDRIQHARHLAEGLAELAGELLQFHDLPEALEYRQCLAQMQTR